MQRRFSPGTQYPCPFKKNLSDLLIGQDIRLFEGDLLNWYLHPPPQNCLFNYQAAQRQTCLYWVPSDSSTRLVHATSWERLGRAQWTWTRQQRSNKQSPSRSWITRHPLQTKRKRRRYPTGAAGKGSLISCSRAWDTPSAWEMCGGSLISAARTVEVGDTLPHLLSNLPQDFLPAVHREAFTRPKPTLSNNFHCLPVETCALDFPPTP